MIDINHNKFNILVKEGEENLRLDIFLSSRLKNISRSMIERLIKKGHVLIDGYNKKPSYKVKKGQIIEVFLPEPEPYDLLEPEDVPFELLYQDSDIAVVSKPSGVVVHPGAGRKKGTLVSGLLYRIQDLSGVGGLLRPGIVHRLDMETSGVMVIAKNDHAHKILQLQFIERQVFKLYIALVTGSPVKKEATIDTFFGRHPRDRKRYSVVTFSKRRAITYYRVISETKGSSLLFVKPKTGRTHQIRVHMKYISCPIVGDRIYGSRRGELSHGITTPAPRLMLHATVISFKHPTEGKKMIFSSWPQNDMLDYFSESGIDIESIEKQLKRELDEIGGEKFSGSGIDK